MINREIMFPVSNDPSQETGNKNKIPRRLVQSRLCNVHDNKKYGCEMLLKKKLKAMQFIINSLITRKTKSNYL